MDLAYWSRRYKSSPCTNRAVIHNRNRKLGYKIYHFMLPTHVCESKAVATTKLCEEICYAKKNNYTLPHVVARMALNYQWSQTNMFVDQITEQLQVIQKKRKPVKRFRIHTSGDFYDTNYYYKWIEIANEFPNIRFLAYTKNIQIDFNEAPSNFILKFSVDSTSIDINPTAKHYAHLRRDVPYFVVEDHLKEHFTGIKICHSDCKDCNYCWGKTSIIFPERKKKIKEKQPLLIDLKIFN